ncbi:hypothetical protein ACFFGH_25435 [Lysobacter korlensis]|uniref:Uncharacterized protein n=1 Tax=Lysobacter korlensis TaxID=553636 RepID=A0ABV6RW28_9GAMM
MSTITLATGDVYIARLHGGEFDGVDRYAMAESDSPNTIVVMQGSDGIPVEYEWNGFLAHGCGVVSAGYSLRRGA